MRPILMQFHPALRRSFVFMLPLAVLVVAVLARVTVSSILDRLSLICFDFYQRAAPREAGEAPIRIVDIDDDSLAKVGQWPWPRTIIAQLVEKLRDAGAAAIAFDIDFAESDRTSPEALLPMLTQSGVDAADAQRLLASVVDPDQQLAKAMRTVPVVTGFIMAEQGGPRLPAAKAGFALLGNDPLAHVDGFPKAIPNLPMFEEAAAGNGFLNQYVDWDHIVRRIPLVLRLGDIGLSVACRRSPKARIRRAGLRFARRRSERGKELWREHRADRGAHRTAAGDTNRRRGAGMALLFAPRARPKGLGSRCPRR